jgi:hypothetical protein
MDGEMKYNKTIYYQNMLTKGLEYQDFVSDILFKELGIPVVSYQSKKYQYNKGENLQGFEIKFDDKMNDTNNIYIEVAEKSKAENINYISSGIYRNDNTWLYIIGNYKIIYIFSKNILKMLHESNRYRYIQTKTSQGFLIPDDEAVKFASKIIFLP